MAEYIKREAALSASKIVYIECIEIDGEGYEDGNADEIPVVFTRDIEAIPAADVVPVRHGRFGKHTSPFTAPCFECGTSMNTYWHYGPNCGAKMDLEEI